MAQKEGFQAWKTYLDWFVVSKKGKKKEDLYSQSLIFVKRTADKTTIHLLEHHQTRYQTHSKKATPSRKPYKKMSSTWCFLRSFSSYDCWWLISNDNGCSARRFKRNAVGLRRQCHAALSWISWRTPPSLRRRASTSPRRMKRWRRWGGSREGDVGELTKYCRPGPFMVYMVGFLQK